MSRNTDLKVIDVPEIPKEELEKAYEVRDVWMYNLNVDPVFDPIRNEPRFRALLKKMNLE